MDNIIAKILLSISFSAVLAILLCIFGNRLENRYFNGNKIPFGSFALAALPMLLIPTLIFIYQIRLEFFPKYDNLKLTIAYCVVFHAMSFSLFRLPFRKYYIVPREQIESDDNPFGKVTSAWAVITTLYIGVVLCVFVFEIPEINNAWSIILSVLCLLFILLIGGLMYFVVLGFVSMPFEAFWTPKHETISDSIGFINWCGYRNIMFAFLVIYLIALSISDNNLLITIDYIITNVLFSLFWFWGMYAVEHHENICLYKNKADLMHEIKALNEKIETSDVYMDAWERGRERGFDSGWNACEKYYSEKKETHND